LINFIHLVENELKLDSNDDQSPDILNFETLTSFDEKYLHSQTKYKIKFKVQNKIEVSNFIEELKIYYKSAGEELQKLKISFETKKSYQKFPFDLASDQCNVQKFQNDLRKLALIHKS
jgi:hypothetical protein